MTLDDLLKKTEPQLNELFGNAQPGPIPDGEGKGRAIIAPGSKLTDEIADLLNLFAWQGKVFERDKNDPGKAELRNKILPIGLRAIVAKVYRGNSWFDDKPCIVLDYSKSSLLARKIRDEIREVAPGLYLGKVYWGDREPNEKALIHFALQF